MCKDNYAATVQKIMPIEVRPAWLFDRGNLRESRIYAQLMRHILTINPPLNREFVLTLFFWLEHNYLYRWLCNQMPYG